MTWFEKTAYSLNNPSQSYQAALGRWRGGERTTKPVPSDFGLPGEGRPQMPSMEPDETPYRPASDAPPVAQFHSRSNLPAPPPAPIKPAAPPQPQIALPPPVPIQAPAPVPGMTPGIPRHQAPRVTPVAPEPAPPPRNIPPMLPQQRAAADFIVKHDGRGILAHVTGAGKTRSAVEGFQALKAKGKAKKAIVITPAGLRTNFAEEGVRRFTDESVSIIASSGERGPGYASKDAPDKDATYHVVSYEMFKQDPEGIIKRTGADTLIMDELHRVKDPSGATFKALRSVRPLVRNVIGMTGSLVSTSPANILQPVDLVTGGAHGLGSPAEFDRKYLKRNEPHHAMKEYLSPSSWMSWMFSNKPQRKGEITGWNRHEELRGHLNDVVHYVGADSVEGQMPKKNVETVRVEMSPIQEHAYRAALKELDAPIVHKLDRGADVNEDEEGQVFNRLVKARQVANSLHTMTDLSLAEAAQGTPKLQKMLDDLEDHLEETKDGQAIIYTNLVHGGVDIIREGLKQRGIEFGTFIGKGNDDITESSRQQDVRDYKDGKKKVIIISGAGNEGVSLPNTTFHAAYDGHFNPEKVLQAEARGVRTGGQSHRAQGDRKVVVKRYMTVYPESKTWFGKTKSYFKEQNPDDAVDSWIYSRADKRHNLNQQLYDIIKGREPGQHSLFPLPEKTKPDSSWWWSGKSAAEAYAHKSERQADQDLPSVGRNEGPLLEPEAQSLGALRGPGNQGLRPLAGILELLRGRGGAAVPRGPSGAPGQQRGLHTGERVLGHLEDPGAEPAHNGVDRVQGSNALPGGLGPRDRTERAGSSVPAEAMGHGAGSDRAQDREQWKAPVGQSTAPSNQVAALRGLDVPEELKKIAVFIMKAALEMDHEHGVPEHLAGDVDSDGRQPVDVDPERHIDDVADVQRPVVHEPAREDRVEDVLRAAPAGAGATSRIRVSLRVPEAVSSGRVRSVARMVADALEQVPDIRKVSYRLENGAPAVDGFLHAATKCAEVRERIEAALQSVVASDPKASLDEDPMKIHLKVATLIESFSGVGCLDSNIERGATIGQGPRRAPEERDAIAEPQVTRALPRTSEQPASDLPTDIEWQRTFMHGSRGDVPVVVYQSSTEAMS